MKTNNKNMTLDQKIDLAIKAFHEVDITEAGCNPLQKRIEAMFNVLTVEDVRNINKDSVKISGSVSK